MNIFPSPPHPDSPSGFTLVEIMVTLVIIAIAAALVSPAIMSMAPGMELKTAARNLYSDVQRAKILAIKENRDVGIRIGTAGYTVGEPFTDANNNGLHDAAEAYTDTNGDGAYTPNKVVVFATAYDFPIGLGIGNVVTQDWDGADCGTAGNSCNTPEAAITFNSRGTANADSAFLEVTPPPAPATPKDYNNFTYAVTVGTAGAVKLRKYNGLTPFATANWVE